MPKLPIFSPKEFISFLEKRGFVVSRTSGSHVILYNKKRRVVVPFHRKDLPKGTFLSIIKASGIDREDFEMHKNKKKLQKRYNQSYKSGESDLKI